MYSIGAFNCEVWYVRLWGVWFLQSIQDASTLCSCLLVLNRLYKRFMRTLVWQKRYACRHEQAIHSVYCFWVLLLTSILYNKGRWESPWKPVRLICSVPWITNFDSLLYWKLAEKCGPEIHSENFDQQCYICIVYWDVRCLLMVQ
jgi:hypothetical protein